MDKNKKYFSVGVKLVGFYVILGLIPLIIAYYIHFMSFVPSWRRMATGISVRNPSRRET